jgi:hypothetical protein
MTLDSAGNGDRLGAADAVGGVPAPGRSAR